MVGWVVGGLIFSPVVLLAGLLACRHEVALLNRSADDGVIDCHEISLPDVA